MPVVQVSYRLEHQALGRILPGHYLPNLCYLLIILNQPKTLIEEQQLFSFFFLKKKKTENFTQKKKTRLGCFERADRGCSSFASHRRCGFYKKGKALSKFWCLNSNNLPDLHLQRSGVIYYIADVDISDHGAEYNFSGALRKFDLLFDLEIVVYGAKDHQARNHQNEGWVYFYEQRHGFQPKEILDFFDLLFFADLICVFGFWGKTFFFWINAIFFFWINAIIFILSECAPCRCTPSVLLR